MGRILVVDDQSHVRAAILTMLRAKGYAAVGVGDATSALHAFDTAPFDLVVADVYLPGTDGVRLIKDLRARNPDLPVIAISGVLLGHSERTALDIFPLAPGLNDIACLQKPFRVSALLDLIETLLGGRRQGAGATETMAPG
jgi:CheY-like chemotaxis protein